MPECSRTGYGLLFFNRGLMGKRDGSSRPGGLQQRPAHMPSFNPHLGSWLSRRPVVQTDLDDAALKALQISACTQHKRTFPRKQREPTSAAAEATMAS